MKALKIFGIVIGSIIGLVIIVGVIFLDTLEPTIGYCQQGYTCPLKLTSRPSLDTKWNNFADAVVQSPPGTPHTLTLTQEEVNSKVNEELKTLVLPAGLGVSNVNVNLTNGKILLSADVTYSVFSGNAGWKQR